MFLLFGTRASEAILSVVAFVCGYCNTSAPQRVVKRVTKFTLFFIPLFPVSTSYFVECTNCGGTTKLTREQADNSVVWAANAHGASGSTSTG